MNKYKKWYQQITQNGKTSRKPGDERHHILPRSLGGSDEVSNIAFITAREHFICHWLLTKIYPTGEEHWKMINAFRMMRAENPRQQRYTTKITARVYENLKKEYSKIQSQRVSGENNPMHGNKFFRSEEGKKRQRQAVSGENNGAKQDQSRKKISKSKLGKNRQPFNNQWKDNLSKNHKSKKLDFNGLLSEETRRKIGDKIRGRKQTDEEKARRGAANIGKKREKVHCIHCNQMVAVNGYARWHGDRCRNR